MIWRAELPRWQWLDKHATGWQFGEQGVLQAIAARLPHLPRRVAEIGAGNGCELPVTVGPFIEQGWAAKLWEADDVNAANLATIYPTAELFGRIDPDCLLAINVGILVIDIDSDDWRVLAGLSTRPPVILCEHANLNGEQDYSLVNLNGRQATWQHLEGIVADTHRLIGRSLVNSLFVSLENLRFLD